MTTYVAQIAPQRSTQYAALANALAPHELRLCLSSRSPDPPITSMEPVELGGQDYLKFELAAPLDEGQLREFGMLAMTSAFFEHRDHLDANAGPWLRPIETGFTPAFPPDLVVTRRYKGKTNELFTQFLCNIARYSSAFAAEPWPSLRLFDPLAGGGTTLFAALVLGAAAAGVEKTSGDVETTAAFIEQYAREQHIPCKLMEQRLKKLGRRWWFTLGKDEPSQCVLACGDTVQSAELMNGVKKPHLIVTDLPYGIQHHGELTGLLGKALPVWASLLLPGGAIAMAWESTRFPRADMISLVEATCPLIVLNEPPYDQLSHRVDRVIKHRDVLVARSY
ncbi:MAG: hypothetical protein M1546_21430 [Chloroflexi bacterium]|nr:hypothetical protein [Chloroflexota bacterium]